MKTEEEIRERLEEQIEICHSEDCNQYAVGFKSALQFVLEEWDDE